jgi:Ran-binding protein 9/10
MSSVNSANTDNTNSTNSNHTLELIKERLKDEVCDTSFLRRNELIREEYPIDCKMFPLKKRLKSEASHFKPSYVETLNFDWARYELPSSFSLEDRSNRLEVSGDGLLVKYVGPGRNDSDAASIRSNIPIPPQVGIYYFEVRVNSRGKDGYIAAGFAIKSASLARLTGWEPGTVGYHADDGNLYRGAGNGSVFGPGYSTNDVVGCGINFVEKSFFFTKNGILIGEVGNLKDKFHLPFFPSIGCRTIGEVLTANFGSSKFCFDIESFIRRKEKRSFSDIEKSTTFNPDSLVVSYLTHCGYKSTAEAFLRSTGKNPKDLENSFRTAQHRLAIVEGIRCGEMGRVHQLINEHFPSFLMENISMAFRLECLNFIELVRKSNNTNNNNYNSSIKSEHSPQSSFLIEILENGKRLTSAFPPGVGEENGQLLQNTLALLAYPDPSNSPVAFLLEKAFKIDMAGQFDLALLKHEGKSAFSPLHQTLKQCQVVMDELQYLENPEIALIDL